MTEANDLRGQIATRVVEAVADPDVMLTDAGLVHTNPDS